MITVGMLAFLLRVAARFCINFWDNDIFVQMTMEHLTGEFWKLLTEQKKCSRAKIVKGITELRDATATGGVNTLVHGQQVRTNVQGRKRRLFWTNKII